MKFEKLTPLLIAVLIIAALGLIGEGLGLFKRFRTKTVDPSQLEMQKVVQTDRENLASGDASDDSISTALQRLSLRTDPFVKNYIRKYAGHRSPQVQAAAAEAAGSFADEGFLPLLKEALNSQEEEVRLGALRGLSRQGGAVNENLIYKHLQKTGHSDSEKYQTYLTMLKITSDANRRLLVLNKLIELIEKSGLDDKMTDVFLYAPNEPRLITKAKQIFAQGNSPTLLARAIQYLVAFDKSWIKEHLHEVKISDNLKFQLVLLDALRSLCPSQKNVLLEKLRGMPANPEVQRNIEEFSCSA